MDNKTVYAHRCILIARCEFLEKMLNGPMKESESSVITLSHVSYNSFIILLEYFYTETVKIFKENPIDQKLVLELLILADQYLVNDLKLQCEVVLSTCLDVERVCKVLEIADIHRSIILRKKCMEYIVNNFGQVIVQDHFLDMPKSILKEILLEVGHRGVYVGQKQSAGNNSNDYGSTK